MYLANLLIEGKDTGQNLSEAEALLREVLASNDLEAKKKAEYLASVLKTLATASVEDIAPRLLAGPLTNSNLSAVTVEPSTAAKALDDWHGEPTLGDFTRFFKTITKESEKTAKADPQKASANAFGMLLGNDLIWTYAIQYASNASIQSVLFRFNGEKEEADDRWVHRCINVQTLSYTNSAQIKRRLNGSFAPGQIVAVRTVTVFGLGAGTVDKLERKDLSPQLTAVSGARYAKLFFMLGTTNDRNEIVFSLKAGEFGSETPYIKTLKVPKSVQNSQIQLIFSSLHRDCPHEWK